MAHRRLAALAAAVALASSPAVGRAQSVPSTVKTFVAVDSVEVHATSIVVVGVLEGGSTVSAVTVSPQSSDTAAVAELVASCQRAAFLAMAKPGQYVLDVYPDRYYGFCRVKRAVQ